MFLVIFGLLGIVYLIIPYLNPFDSLYFDYHDITQPARVSQFFLNLAHLKIPPRMAPNFLFNLSYPVFNFYAPFSYWVSSFFMFLGLDAAAAVEASFSLALILGFIGSFLLFRKYFGKWSAFLSAVVYTTSPYLAVEIFIRGNLGEVWFWALFPWVLYLIKSRKYFLSIIFMHALFTSHNIFSLLAMLLILIFILLQKERKKLLISFFLTLLSTAYFWLPFFAEMKYVQAKKIASQTRYFDHFLCLKQLWSSEDWYFGASVPGCKDYMSFKLGKGQVILGILGLGIFFLKKKYKKNKEFLFFSLLSVLATFLTLYISQPIWKLFEPFLKIVQFPWRFLLFSIFGLAFFSGFLFESFRSRFLKIFFALFLSLALFFVNKKYFFKPLQPRSEFFQRYLSQKAIEEEMAFKIPEYFTVYSDYNAWREIRKRKIELESRVVKGKGIKVLNERNDLFEKRVIIQLKTPSEVTLGVLYFPFWKVYVDEREIKVDKFDRLGMPIVSLIKGKHIIKVIYSQTILEKISNLVAGFTVLLIRSYKF